MAAFQTAPNKVHPGLGTALLPLWLPLLLLLRSAGASTHWVVTEDGKIQEQVYSVFYMRRPYDLVALIQQERRAHLVENFMFQVDGQIEEIDNKRSRDTNLQEKFYDLDQDCVAAQRPLAEYDLFASTVATCDEVQISLQDLKVEIAKLDGRGRDGDNAEPNCSRTSDLEFSMHAFEHLKSMIDRKNVSMMPDLELSKLLFTLEAINGFGHLLHEEMEKNKTSWVLYNMAGYYFRLVGDAYKAIECIRRSLHFSPRELKYVALLNLGEVLHHAGKSEDAAVVISAAVDLMPNDPMLYYTLGNVYAALTEFNKSVEAFDAALELQPDFEAASLRRHAVICHRKLENALETQYDSLQKTLVELGNFEQRLDFWQKQQLKLLQEQASLDVRLGSQIDYAEWKIRQKLNTHVQGGTTGSSKNSGAVGAHKKKNDCSQGQANALSPSSCEGQPMIANVKIHVGHTWSHLFKEVEMQAAKLKDELLLKQSELTGKVATVHTKYPRQPPKNTLSEPPPRYLLPDWPSAAECDAQDIKGELRLSLPAFIPPENKGFDIGKVLGDLEDIVEDGQPYCKADVTAEFDTLWDWIFVNLEAGNDEILEAHNILHKYVHRWCGPITMEEFGHRLTHAMNQDLAPKWLLFHLAFYYWWAMGDVGNFSRCLVNAKILAPAQCKDLILVPIASMLGQEGLLTGAIYSAKFAAQVNEFEPTTNKLLGDLYVLAGDLQNAIIHYKKVLHEEPDDQDALRCYLWVTCRLRSKVTSTGSEVTIKKGPESESDWIDLDEEIKGHCYSNDGTTDCATSSRKQISTLLSYEHSKSGKTAMLETGDETDVDPLEPNSLATGPTSASGGEPSQKIHVKLFLGQDMNPVSSHAPVQTPQPVIDDLLPDILLQVPDRKPAIPPPDLSECKSFPQANFKHFTSTWLSVSAKGVAVSKLLNTDSPVSGPPLQPFCDATLPSSALTLDHLVGMRHRSILTYTSETGLREALQTLGREGEGPESVQSMGTRLTLALQQNSTSWVLTTLAALYWRVIGQAEQAIICLRLSLHYAPRNMRDIPLISLANIFHRAGLHNDALIVANMALENSPGFVVTHFTLANIFAAKGNWEQAKAFYESTLALQSSFEPARDRLRAIYCMALREESATP